MSHSNLERIIALAAKDSKKGARVAAKVFYRILRKNGFMDNQIINIATNILSCLTESLKKNHVKTANTLGHREQSFTSS